MARAFFPDRHPRALVLSFDGGYDGVDSRRQASGIIPVFELRLDLVLRDLFAKSVRQRPFQSVTDLDEHLTVLDEDKKRHAVVLELLADAPRTGHPHGVILNG